MGFRPGISIRIVTDVDLARETIHVKSSMVYDAIGSTIVLAQTDPPLGRSLLGKEVIVTYLIQEKTGTVRHGFPATVVRLIDNYKLTSFQTVRAVEVSRKAEPSPYSIRMFYRVEPTDRSNLTMSVYQEPVNLLDISLGGARFSHNKHFSVERGRTVELYLSIDGKVYTVEGRVQRTWEGDGDRFPHGLLFATVEFVDMPRTLEHALARKIREIEREHRFSEIIP